MVKRINKFIKRESIPREKEKRHVCTIFRQYVFVVYRKLQYFIKTTKYLAENF